MKILIKVIEKMFEADCTSADANHLFERVVTGAMPAEILLQRLGLPSDEATVHDFREYLYMYKAGMATVFRKLENAELEACGLPLKG